MTGPGSGEYQDQQKEMVKSVTYFVSEEFNEATYQSCKNIQFPSLSGTVMSLMCGRWGTNCTAKRWLDFLGNINNGRAPFQISPEYGSGEKSAEGEYYYHYNNHK